MSESPATSASSSSATLPASLQAELQAELPTTQIRGFASYLREHDFLIEVVVPDLEGYEQFLMGRLLRLPGVVDVRSNFAIRTVKSPASLPL